MKRLHHTSWGIWNIIVLSLLCSLVVRAQPMPVEARENIHSLFNQHDLIQRSVELTEKGYIAVTETDNPELASILKSHVRQMRARLKSGKMVRRWDPAFPEMVMHYQDMEHQIKPTEKGLKVIVTGTTPEAVKVAHNHAQIVSAFAKNGWKEHDVRHPIALTEGAILSDQNDQGSPQGGACCEKGCKDTDVQKASAACAKGCCKKEVKTDAE